ncbi:MAG: alkaline phosphatase family protein [Bacteroidetes bacterium]|nr:alkaline phosphatase family protein [Bacteroidota bacterium]
MFRLLKKITAVAFILVLSWQMLPAQKQKTFSAEGIQANKPKLVVGIVVDQMRYDYLFRYWSKYSETGFKKLVGEGFLLKNANYNYVPTYTGPGHACIYTGTTPAMNGIVSNEWYDRELKKDVYCVEDTTMHPLGTYSMSSRVSPNRLLTTTITDELRLSNNFQSKVIGVALKDRGAILPAGHTANAAYWFDKETAHWATSSFYMNELPNWVEEFNAKKMAAELMKEKWNTLLPIDQYVESTADDVRYEGLYAGETHPVFPHDLPAISLKDKDLIKRIPMGNTFTKDFAEAALKGEEMGKGSATDFLAVSFSSTDYVGHQFGINSIEVEDTYLRLDRDLSEFFEFLEKWVGHSNYLLFLTADHGAAGNVTFNTDEKIPSGFFDAKQVDSLLENYLQSVYGPGEFVSELTSHGIYLNQPLLEQKKIGLGDMEEKCAEFFSRMKGVAAAITAQQLKTGNYTEGLLSFIQKGFNGKRSPDVILSLDPSWMEWESKSGTTHGAAYSYDTHVPLLFYGWNIPHGQSSDPVSVTDVAPTVASLLNIEFPSGTTGKPVSALMNFYSK